MADKFSAQKSGNYKVISLLPDCCHTPLQNQRTFPYTISVDLSAAAGTSSNVNINGDPAFLFDQSDTVQDEFKEAIEETEKIINDPQVYAADLAESAVETGEDALIDAKDIAVLNPGKKAQAVG